MVSKADAVQWGGGVVAEFSVVSKAEQSFQWSPKADAIQWGGGGVVAWNFLYGVLLHY